MRAFLCVFLSVSSAFPDHHSTRRVPSSAHELTIAVAKPSPAGDEVEHVGAVAGDEVEHVGAVAGDEVEHVGAVAGDEVEHVGAVAGDEVEHVGASFGETKQHTERPLTKEQVNSLFRDLKTSNGKPLLHKTNIPKKLSPELFPPKTSSSSSSSSSSEGVPVLKTSSEGVPVLTDPEPEFMVDGGRLRHANPTSPSVTPLFSMAEESVQDTADEKEASTADVMETPVTTPAGRRTDVTPEKRKKGNVKKSALMSERKKREEGESKENDDETSTSQSRNTEERNGGGRDATKTAKLGEQSLLWMGPLVSWSGFATEARSFIDLLSGPEGLENLYARQFGDVMDENVLDTLPAWEQQKLTSSLNKHGPDPENGVVVVCHSVPSQWFGAGQYFTGGEEPHQCPPSSEVVGEVWSELDKNLNIGRAMFETDSLPPGWADKCNMMDEVWVPSKFNVETFAGAGVSRKKLFVVPEAVDTEDRFNPNNANTPYELPVPLTMDPELSAFSQLLQVFGHTTASHSEPFGRTVDKHPPAIGHMGKGKKGRGFRHGTFNFLSIFKWHRRKGVDVLLRAYCEEFSADEPVVLYMKTNVYNTDPNADLTALLEEISQGLNIRRGRLPRMRLIEDWIPDARLPSLYAAADAFVLPSRGEGWGLPQAEAMAMGLPTIATDWSGTTEFINKDVGLPLKYSLKELTTEDMDDMYIGAELNGHKYAEPSVSHLRELMRWVYDHPDEGMLLGKKARDHMKQRFSYKAVRGIVKDRLHQTAPALQ